MRCKCLYRYVEFTKAELRSGDFISAPFINLPSRTMRDYYSLIRKPVCLKGVQKMVRGIKGRDKPTGVTLFRSWQSFEDEMSYIWINARDYNEPGSPIPKMADRLEVYKSISALWSPANGRGRLISSVVLLRRKPWW